MRRLLILSPLLALAACDAPAPAPADNAVAANTTDFAATVAALPAGQRNGVLFRAIRDAGRDCQQVTASSRAGAVEGDPAWSAICDGRSQWVVVLRRDGIATVVSAAEVARAGG